MTPAIGDHHPEHERRNDRSVDREEILSDPHSRRVLDYLRRTDGPVDIATIATQVVADLTDRPPEDVPSNVTRRVQTWLHHGQLPLLDEHGVIEYDPDRGTVRLARERSRDRSRGGVPDRP